MPGNKYAIPTASCRTDLLLTSLVRRDAISDVVEEEEEEEEEEVAFFVNSRLLL